MRSTPDLLIAQSENFSGLLFSILKDHDDDQGVGGLDDVAKTLAWQLLMDIPSVKTIHSSVQSLATNPDTDESDWTVLLP